jgi:hypothetical protein
VNYIQRVWIYIFNTSDMMWNIDIENYVMEWGILLLIYYSKCLRSLSNYTLFVRAFYYGGPDRAT